jgi:Spy/CpxP family protein refolding chaperone
MTAKNIIRGMLLCSAVFIGNISSAQGQASKTPEEKAQNQLSWMQKNLNLTEEQNKKVQDILQNRAKEVEKNSTNPVGTSKREEKRRIKKETDAELKAALTPDQYNKWQEHKQEMKQGKEQQKKAKGTEAH